jgi:branched-chain amino acid aminotransferase
MVAGHGGQEGRALHYIDGTWHEGNPPLLGPMTHASWMSSIVFDGARAFEGVTPDIDRHCDRLIASARTMGLVPPLAAGEVEEIVHDGVGRFANGAALYIRPMLWAESGFIVPDPHSTRFCCTLFEAPMPEPKGLGVCLSPYRRPTPETALTLAKASCLYPNSVRAIQDAQARGFDNALIRDSMGNIAELATANVWMAKDGAAHTPVPNGCFLNGVTRQRVAKLLTRAGVPVYERTLTHQDFLEADEVFSTGNLGDRDLQPGPIYSRARQLYWDWAHGG